ncbi:hypothetical protein NLN85_22660 [Citrobacter portucalensis]|nr:hypothetical protein [Citrobacter portucalensis]MCX8995275.1 hypothetical protein [Citrobacter portucalensis]MCX9058932.1 hypothetical protein [Citrobacter portucalensis]
MLVKTSGRKAWHFEYYHPVTKKRPKTSLGPYPVVTPSAIWAPDEPRPTCFAGDVTPVNEAEPVPELSAPTQPLPEIADNPRLGDNNNFLQWLKNHTSPSGTVNTRNGKVHVVENHLF